MRCPTCHGVGYVLATHSFDLFGLIPLWEETVPVSCTRCGGSGVTKEAEQ